MFYKIIEYVLRDANGVFHFIKRRWCNYILYRTFCLFSHRSLLTETENDADWMDWEISGWCGIAEGKEKKGGSWWVGVSLWWARKDERKKRGEWVYIRWMNRRNHWKPQGFRGYVMVRGDRYVVLFECIICFWKDQLRSYENTSITISDWCVLSSNIHRYLSMRKGRHELPANDFISVIYLTLYFIQIHHFIYHGSVFWITKTVVLNHWPPDEILFILQVEYLSSCFRALFGSLALGIIWY